MEGQLLVFMLLSDVHKIVVLFVNSIPWPSHFQYFNLSCSSLFKPGFQKPGGPVLIVSG
jgi:hypothetical protein